LFTARWWILWNKQIDWGERAGTDEDSIGIVGGDVVGGWSIKDLMQL
jgi:hypothetical protein